MVEHKTKPTNSESAEVVAQHVPLLVINSMLKKAVYTVLTNDRFWA